MCLNFVFTMTRRIVVTGLGIVLPGNYDVKSAWDSIIQGKSFITKINGFDTTDYPTKIAAEIKWSGIEYLRDGSTPEQSFIYDNPFDPIYAVEKKEVKKMDKFILYIMHAVEQAVSEAGLKNTNIDPERIGVLVGSGIGGLQNIEEMDRVVIENGPRKISPFFIPSVLINLTSGQISIKYGYKGPNFSIVSACATAAHSIGEAARSIVANDADIMIAGGSESTISRLGIGGFNALRALSTNFNDTPTKASRPWDRDRDGFVMGEGGAILVLEEYEHAKKRGANIYCELGGYGATADGHHLTAPHPEGDGACAAMKMAIKKSGLDLDSIKYINAHGTSTPLGDEIEVKAIKRIFGERPNIFMSSTKSSTGHLLGAAGGIEAIFSILALKEGILPPTLNLENPSDGCDLDFVKDFAKEVKTEAVISNSFGFGGCNASLLFKKI